MIPNGTLSAGPTQYPTCTPWLKGSMFIVAGFIQGVWLITTFPVSEYKKSPTELK